VSLLAHGIGAVRDLPIPFWLLLYGAAVVLIASFVALGVLWKQPKLGRRAEGRSLGPGWQRILLGPEIRVALGALSFGLLVLVFAAAAFGEDSVATNLAPTFVWVVFWLGFVPLVILFGNVWSVLSPWRAAADAVAWSAGRAGVRWQPPLQISERVGRWPAAVLLGLFAALELAYPHSSTPRTLAIAIGIYTWITWLGMAAVGREQWLRYGEAFNVYFGLLARLSPFGVVEREGRRTVVIRTPGSSLALREDVPGTLPFVAVMLGSVAFDGFSRTNWWQERIFSIESRFVLDNPRVADIALTAFNVVGLIGAVALVALIYLLAIEGARLAAAGRGSLAEEFVGSLVPIALAYAVAHYFSLFVLQGQVTWRLISDPFGWGWDLFGTRDYQPRLDLLTPNLVAYVQVAALVVGHVLGLVIAHDRAVALFHRPGLALRTQFAMLVVMVVFTMFGLWLVFV
jgi:hypothetical protein